MQICQWIHSRPADYPKLADESTSTLLNDNCLNWPLSSHYHLTAQISHWMHAVNKAFCILHSCLSTYCPNWLMNAAIYSFLFSKLRTTCVTCQTSNTSEYSNFLTAKTSHWPRSGIVNHNSKQMTIRLFGTSLCIDIINRSKGPYAWKLCQAAVSGNNLMLNNNNQKRLQNVFVFPKYQSIALTGTTSQQKWEQLDAIQTKQNKKKIKRLQKVFVFPKYQSRLH